MLCTVFVLVRTSSALQKPTTFKRSYTPNFRRLGPGLGLGLGLHSHPTASLRSTTHTCESPLAQPLLAFEASNEQRSQFKPASQLQRAFHITWVGLYAGQEGTIAGLAWLCGCSAVAVSSCCSRQLLQVGIENKALRTSTGFATRNAPLIFCKNKQTLTSNIGRFVAGDWMAERSLRGRSNGSLRDHGHLGTHAHLGITFTDHLGSTFTDHGGGGGWVGGMVSTPARLLQTSLLFYRITK